MELEGCMGIVLEAVKSELRAQTYLVCSPLSRERLTVVLIGHD